MSVLVVFLVVLVVATLLQAIALQVSVALSGEPAPRFGRALWTALVGVAVASLASGLFAVTAGWMLAWFAPQLSQVLGFAIAVGAAAVVYRARLRTGLLHAAAMAVVQQALLWGIGVLGGFLF